MAQTLAAVIGLQVGAKAHAFTPAVPNRAKPTTKHTFWSTDPQKMVHKQLQRNSPQAKLSVRKSRHSTRRYSARNATP